MRVIIISLQTIWKKKKKNIRKNVSGLFELNNFHFNCSDAKNMANDVRNILLNIIKTKGNMDEASALQYLKKMEAQKRYSADVWS